MILKNDDVLMRLTAFGFRCEERTQEGFLRYSKRIGDLVVTVANGQFENKIRISMLQDSDGKIRTTHQDIMAYTDMIGEMMIAKIVEEEIPHHTMDKDLLNMVGDEEQTREDVVQDVQDMENPLLCLPRKPEGFMAQ